MEVYRIHHRAYSALDGTGAALRGARWNPIGSRVIYAALTYEGAILEQLVHAGGKRLPRNQVVSQILLPENAPVDVIVVIPDAAWHDETLTQAMGFEWLEAGESLALPVPSAVARPHGQNVLINPGHEAFPHVEVIHEAPVAWDSRLF